MSTEDYKRISWLLGPDALRDLIGLDSIDGMLHIGNEAEWLLYKLSKFFPHVLSIPFENIKNELLFANFSIR